MRRLYQVFISSTFTDLVKARSEVSKALCCERLSTNLDGRSLVVAGIDLVRLLIVYVSI